MGVFISMKTLSEDEDLKENQDQNLDQTGTKT